MYKPLKNLVPREHCQLISSIIQNQPIKEGDNQVPNSWSYSNLPAGNIMLGWLTQRISEEAGKTLLPSYSYTRIYNSGDVLEPHIDRDSCEWSVTINLSQTHPWPIYMDKTEINMEPGDGVLYQGTVVEHHRKAFQGLEYIQMFLHYVDANGPYMFGTGIGGSSSAAIYGFISFSYLDSPATTSSTTYKTQQSSYQSNMTVVTQVAPAVSAATSTITLMEIAA